ERILVRAARADRPQAGEIEQIRRKLRGFQYARALRLGNGAPRADACAVLDDLPGDHAFGEPALEEAFVQTVAAVGPVERDRNGIVSTEDHVDRATIDIGPHPFGR